MATRSAGARVAGIPELLEHILLDLTSEPPSRDYQRHMMRTLLRCLRVSHRFRDTIIGSPKLERELYGVACDTPHEVGTFNPLLKKLYVKAPDGNIYQTFRKCTEGKDDYGIAEVEFRKFQTQAEWRGRRRYTLAPDGSWRKMYFWRTRHEVVSVANDTGIIRKVSLINPTVGDVYNAVFADGMPLSQSMTARSYHNIFIPV